MTTGNPHSNNITVDKLPILASNNVINEGLNNTGNMSVLRGVRAKAAKESSNISTNLSSSITPPPKKKLFVRPFEDDYESKKDHVAKSQSNFNADDQQPIKMHQSTVEPSLKGAQSPVRADTQPMPPPPPPPPVTESTLCALLNNNNNILPHNKHLASRLAYMCQKVSFMKLRALRLLC